MESINIKGKIYTYTTDYRDAHLQRGHFNRLTENVYGFNFEDWYQSGYWGKEYIPYSLLDGEKMVSNVSISIIDFLVFGEKRTFVQIGTVMTDPTYRHKGLNKVLLEKVLEEWRGRCDLIYLFANNTVLEFYPKFGFKRVDEYQHSKSINSLKSNFTIKPKKLNMASSANREFLIQKINATIPFSKISMIGNSSLVMFYLTSFMTENVYYLQEFDAIVVVEYQYETLFLQDVFCTEFIDLDVLISVMANRETKKVVLGFTPNDTSSFKERVHTPDDVLFILDDKWGIFKGVKVLFPVLSHA